MKFHLCINASYEKVVELHEYVKGSFGDFNEHTLIAVPAEKKKEVYVVTTKKGIKTLLQEAFLNTEITEKAWLMILQKEKRPPELIGLQSLVS